MNFVREHKWLAILLVLSLLVILAGVFMIKQANQQQAEQQSQVDKLNTIATQATQGLLQTLGHSEEPIDDIIPEESLAKVKAMNGVVPAEGTEDWCEWMMVKDADSWTEQEQALFAQHCI